MGCAPIGLSSHEAAHHPGAAPRQLSRRISSDGCGFRASVAAGRRASRQNRLMARLTDEQRAQRAATRRRNEALAVEAENERQEIKRSEWVANGTWLTRQELDDGVPCRGCGLPIVDGWGARPALSDLTASQRAEHDADEAAYAARHPDCRSHRWTLSDSRTQHCGFCCPPPPLSTAQIDQISRIVNGQFVLRVGGQQTRALVAR